MYRPPADTVAVDDALAIVAFYPYAGNMIDYPVKTMSARTMISSSSCTLPGCAKFVVNKCTLFCSILAPVSHIVSSS